MYPALGCMALWLPHTRSCKAVRPINSFEPSNQVPSPHWVPGNRSFAKIVVWQPNSTLNDAKALPGIPWWRAPEGMYGIPYTNIYQCFHLDPDKYLPWCICNSAPPQKLHPVVRYTWMPGMGNAEKALGKTCTPYTRCKLLPLF